MDTKLPPERPTYESMVIEGVLLQTGDDLQDISEQPKPRERLTLAGSTSLIID